MPTVPPFLIAGDGIPCRCCCPCRLLCYSCRLAGLGPCESRDSRLTGDLCVHMNSGTAADQVSPLSLPGQSELTTIGSTPPKTLPRRGLFLHHFFLPFLTQLKSHKASQDDPFWRPKSGQDRPKTRLETFFFRKVEF